MLSRLEENDHQTEIRKVKFTSFEDAGTYASEPDFHVFDGLKVNMVVELSSTFMTLRELLSMEEGHLICLEKVAGEPVDVRFNGEVFAKGEVVVINEVFGIRISSLIGNNNE